MPPDLLARYQPWRRWAEPGFWVVLLGLQAAANSIVSWFDLARNGPGAPFWQPLVWEVSSTLVIGALIPLVLAADRRFPLDRQAWRRSLPLHLLLTVPFCLAHVAGMVALRKLCYVAAGLDYAVADWGRMVFYEYLKDVRTYALILVAFWSYRQVLLRLQGEARLLDPPEPPAGAVPEAAPAAPQRPERFLVRKLRKEFLVAAADIEWLQAQGNYVGLHVNGHDYLLRSTLADFLEQLDPARFARVHRSYAVNLDRIAEIEPLDAGDARLKMKDGSFVPCSRRYRDALGS
jgi:hypothetical protein